MAEIAIAFGVEKSTVTRWANEGLLPEPIDTLMLGRIWSYKSIFKLFAIVNFEVEALDEGAGRIYGECLRALKTLRDMREQE